MSITAILSGMITIAAAIPKVKEMVDLFMSMWTDHKINEAADYLSYKQLKQKALYKAIKDARDDETRIALSIVLSDIGRM